MRRNIFRRIAAVCAAVLIIGSNMPAEQLLAEEPVINVSVDTEKDRHLISPYIYGVNFGTNLFDVNVNALKQGGTRFTTYNWENNFSNSGSDWFHNSDNSLVSGLGNGQQDMPGLAAEALITEAAQYNIPMILTTLPMSNYVAADGNGPVLDDQIAPSLRWTAVSFKKRAPFSLKPDLEDGTIYVDEYLNFLINRYGKSSTNTGIKGYALDNEPELWNVTHQTMQSSPLTPEQLIIRSAELASVIKGLDENALIFGGQFAGAKSLIDMQGSEDWAKISENYNWFLDYYLEQMKKAGAEKGGRMLDVLDFHYSSEDAAEGCVSVAECNNPAHEKCNLVRMQSVRTLWDGSYTENSVLGREYKQYIPLLPTVQASVNKYYSGTKIALSSYNFGGGSHISGGIAEVDALGTFAKHSVYLACLDTDNQDIPFQKAALNLFTNYDGRGTGFGNTWVKTEIDNNERASAYASIDNADDKVLKIILTNKNPDSRQTVNLAINSGKEYKYGIVYGFGEKNSSVKMLHTLANIGGNSFSYTLEPLSAVELILYSDSVDISEIPDMSSESSDVSGAPIETTGTMSETTSTVNVPETPAATEISSSQTTPSPVTSVTEPNPDGERETPLAMKIAAVFISVLTLVGIAYLFYGDIASKFKKQK